MSRTTTVYGAPASDTDKQSISQPNQFIKRGTPQFMRVTLALFSAGLATPLKWTVKYYCSRVLSQTPAKAQEG